MIRVFAQDQQMNLASLIARNVSRELRGRFRGLLQMHRHNDAFPTSSLRNAVSNRKHRSRRIADDAQCRRADEKMCDVMPRVRSDDDQVRSFASSRIAD